MRWPAPASARVHAHHDEPELERKFRESEATAMTGNSKASGGNIKSIHPTPSIINSTPECAA